MIEILRKTLPYLLVLFFIIKANKESLYLLGIPFLKFMGTSIFFENAKPFNLPGSLYYQLLFIWLILLWIVSKLIYPNKKGKIIKTYSTIDYCIIGLIIISIGGLISSLVIYKPLAFGILEEFWLEISLFAGYFIIRDWISNKNPETLINFFYSLVIVNTIAAVLFILHQGIHIGLYTTEEYLTESIQDQEITRTFWFQPQFLLFSVIFILVFRKKYSLIGFGLLAVNLLAIAITYTISSMIIALLMIILYFILTGLKNHQLWKAFKNITLYAIVGIIGLIILAKLLPANTAYLMSRFSNLSESQYTQKDPNTLVIRFMYTEAVLTKINKYKMIFGMGPLTEIQNPGVVEMKATTADMVWVGVIFRWGLVGLSLFIIIYLFSLYKAFIIFMKAENIISDLALIIFLFVISQILESFVSWTFLSEHGYATGLWYFAILSVVIRLHKMNTISNLNSSKELVTVIT